MLLSSCELSDTAAHRGVPADTGTARVPTLQPGTHLSTGMGLHARSRDLIQLSSPAQPNSQLHFKKSVREDSEDCLSLARWVCFYELANLHNIQTFQINSYKTMRIGVKFQKTE